MCDTTKITREEAVRVAVDALKKLITNNGGRLKMVDKNWLWKPVDGNVYYDSGNILRDFEKQLKNDLLK